MVIAVIILGTRRVNPSALFAKLFDVTPRSVPIIGLLVGYLVMQRRSSGPKSISLNAAATLPTLSTLNQPTQPIASPQIQAQLINCWACRGQIIGKMKGCPGCGARYHLDGTPGCNVSSLTHCVNCNTLKSEFLDA